MRQKRHALRLVVDNSTDDNACKSSSDNSTSARRAASKRGKKCLGGTPRCRHFLNASRSMPMSADSRRNVDQVSITKEYGDDASPLSTPKRSQRKRPSKKSSVAQQCAMGVSREESDFNAVFRMRTKLAREAADLTQAEAAQALGVELDTYKKWENRPTSAIPRHKMLAFCLLMRVECRAMLEAPTKQEILQAKPANLKRA